MNSSGPTTTTATTTPTTASARLRPSAEAPGATGTVPSSAGMSSRAAT
jgi:hypothetical protein